MSVNSKMTAIADAIRAKTGESSDVKYGLDAMAQAIAALEIGGGGAEIPDWINEINFGMEVYPKTTYSVEVAHGLSGTPAGFVFYRKGADTSSELYLNYCYGYSYTYYNTSSGGTFRGTTILANGSSARNLAEYTANSSKFSVFNSTYNYACKTNTPYFWIAWR